MATPLDADLAAGPHEIAWRPGAGVPRLPAGLYFAVLDAPDGRAVRRLALVR